MHKLKGAISPYMTGLIVGVMVVSTLSANKAKLNNENSEREYISLKYKHLSKLSKTLDNNLAIEQPGVSSELTEQKVQQYIYTNIFDTSEVKTFLNKNSEIATISIEKNQYLKNKALSADSTNNLVNDYTSDFTKIVSEKTTREEQVQISYDSMKEQAVELYNDVTVSGQKKWPCEIEAEYKDAWGRDFNYNRVDDFNADLSYNLPWDEQTNKMLSLSLPVVDLNTDKIVEILATRKSTSFRTKDGRHWSVENSNWQDTGLKSVKAIKQTDNKYALLENGDLWVKGANKRGSLGLGHQNIVEDWVKLTSDVSLIETEKASSSSSTYVVKNDGKLWVAGANTKGQLGYNYAKDIHTLTHVHEVTKKVKSIHPIADSATIFFDDNMFMSTGYNASSHLGRPSPFDNFEDRWFYPLAYPIKQYHYDKAGHATYLIDHFTNFYGSGIGTSGNFGNGASQSYSYYTLLSSAGDFKDFVTVGVDSLFVIKKDGSLWATGNNLNGELGFGHKNNVTRLTDTGLDGIIKVKSTYQSNTYALDVNKNLWVAGLNNYGALGIGNTENQLVFVKALENVKSVHLLSENSVVALKTDGTVWVAGDNRYGQLGLGHTSNVTRFTKIPNIPKIEYIPDYPGYNLISTSPSLFMVDENSHLWAAGLNDYGQLGTGDTKNRTKPVKVFDTGVFLFSC